MKKFILFIERKGTVSREFAVQNNKKQFLGDIVFNKTSGKPARFWPDTDAISETWFTASCLMEVADFMVSLEGERRRTAPNSRLSAIAVLARKFIDKNPGVPNWIIHQFIDFIRQQH